MTKKSKSSKVGRPPGALNAGKFRTGEVGGEAIPIGDQIKSLVALSEQSPSAIADGAGMASSLLYAIMGGQRMPSPDAISRIVWALADDGLDSENRRKHPVVGKERLDQTLSDLFRAAGYSIRSGLGHENRAFGRVIDAMPISVATQAEHSKFGSQLERAPKPGPIRIGVSELWPLINADKNRTACNGLAWSILELVCDIAGIDHRVPIVLPWSQLVPELEAGKVDLLAPMIAITPQRGLHVQFTRPIPGVNASMNAVVRKRDYIEVLGRSTHYQIACAQLGLRPDDDAMLAHVACWLSGIQASIFKIPGEDPVFNQKQLIAALKRHIAENAMFCCPNGNMGDTFFYALFRRWEYPGLKVHRVDAEDGGRPAWLTALGPSSSYGPCPIFVAGALTCWRITQDNVADYCLFFDNGGNLPVTSYAFAVAKREPLLCKLLNECLDLIEESGALDSLINSFKTEHADAPAYLFRTKAPGNIGEVAQ